MGWWWGGGGVVVGGLSICVCISQWCCIVASQQEGSGFDPGGRAGPFCREVAGSLDGIPQSISVFSHSPKVCRLV